MNEDFIPDVRLDSTRLLNDLEEFLTRALVVRVMSIDHVDERSTILNVLN